jgi:predicted Rossmann fold flavoprotein
LTPLETDDASLKKLAGVSLPSRLTLILDGRKECVYEGDFLFTHFGFSGPVVLNISRGWIRGAAAGKKPVLEADFLPGLPADRLRTVLLRASNERPNSSLKNFLAKYLPARAAETLIRRGGILPETPFNQLKRSSREAVVRALTRCPLSVTGSLGYQKAEVTAGGVDLKEVNPKTLESRLRPGLFLAGEILDADGRIGGFNFQWAWSTGMVAAHAIGAKLCEKN